MAEQEKTVKIKVIGYFRSKLNEYQRWQPGEKHEVLESVAKEIVALGRAELAPVIEEVAEKVVKKVRGAVKPKNA